MARAMTKVQQSNTIRFGSAKFEVGEDEESLVDLGAMRGVEFEESWDEMQVNSDNAGVIIVGMMNQQVAIRGDLMEINLKNLALLRGGIDKVEEVEADAETGKKAAIRLLSGGYSTFQPRVVKITNYNDKNEEFSITIFKATTNSGISITFPGADDEDPAMTPIEMVGTNDVEREIGEQLFIIEDEQGIIPTP
ncbi:MAG TPA: hypothetical protein VK085_06070 [Pseudogracilibacillus sp.]|nr:hypothetical protein [Pseudogracilibacillus sp.]